MFRKANRQGAEGGQGGLRRKLIQSHLVVAGIGVVALLAVLIASAYFRSHAVRLAHLRGPTVAASMRALVGLQRSEAALRGWIVLGDPAYRKERQRAWDTEIHPSLKKLDELSTQWTITENRERLAELKNVLVGLQEEQWWLEDLAQTPGNQPARVLFNQQIRTTADRFILAITALIDLERELPGSFERKQLLATMADLRAYMTQTVYHLSAYVDAGEPLRASQFEDFLGKTFRRQSELESHREHLTPEQLEHFNWLRAELETFRELAAEAISLRQRPDWNRAQDQLAEQLGPQLHLAADLLSTLSADQVRVMRADSRRVARAAHLTGLFSVVLLVGLVVLASVVSTRRAAQLARPITSLSDAARRLASEGAAEDLPVESDDELGWLTRSFNRMRQSLEATRHDLQDQVLNTQRHARELQETNRELDQFTYVASHDLQEPVRNLISFSTLLEEDLGESLPEEAAEDLKHIHNAARQMQSLVQDLLSLSRSGRSAMKNERVSLDECLDQALSALNTRVRETGAEIVRGRLPHVAGDPTMLTQLLYNLLSNALKFQADRRPLVEVTAEKVPEGWRVSLRDNGIGIKPEYTQQIFMPFKRLHGRSEFEGTGIGLAICRKSVERHGGRIWVESRLGQGSQFFFNLPAYEGCREPRDEEQLCLT